MRNAKPVTPLLADLVKAHLTRHGDLRDEKRNRVGPRLRQLGAATARLWRGLSYDDVVKVAQLARDRLGLARPKERVRVVDRLDRPELDRLLAAAYDHDAHRGLLVKTLLYTGARVSELVKLDVSDVSQAGATVTFRSGKGDKDRRVPILPALADELATFIGPRRHGALFQPRGAARRDEHRRRFSPRRVEQIVAELARPAGISKRVYPHLCRHTVAQLLLEGGMPLEQLQRFLGHKNLRTTQIYAESTPVMIREAYNEALG